jgi:hypothetical protein
MKKLFACLVLTAVAGCRMCNSCTDYSPPVAGSPYDAFHTRAGSAFNGSVYPTTPPTPQAPTKAETPPMPLMPIAPAPVNPAG